MKQYVWIHSSTHKKKPFLQIQAAILTFCTMAAETIYLKGFWSFTSPWIHRSQIISTQWGTFVTSAISNGGLVASAKPMLTQILIQIRGFRAFVCWASKDNSPTTKFTYLPYTSLFSTDSTADIKTALAWSGRNARSVIAIPWLPA